MPDHRPKHFVEPVSNWLCTVNDDAHLCSLILGQNNIAGSPVLFQPVKLGSPGNGDKTLRGNPAERNLGRGTSFPLCKFLDLFHNRFVPVEVLALELGNCGKHPLASGLK